MKKYLLVTYIAKNYQNKNIIFQTNFIKGLWNIPAQVFFLYGEKLDSLWKGAFSIFIHDTNQLK